MKKVCIIVPLLFLVVACQGLDNEQKIAEKIKKSVLASCDCTSVNVNHVTNDSNFSKLLVEIENNKKFNLDEKAEEIIANLEEEIPEIAQNDEIIIRFSQGDSFEEFSFEGNSAINNEDLKDENVVSLSHLK